MDRSTSSTESIPPAQPEARIGSYRILNPLGTGGMSSVFRAVHVETNNEVALKVLTRSLAKNSTLLQRFLREARSAETLEHPNIVAIYDRGVDSGRHYLVLEYLAGGDFHDYILQRGPLSLAEAVTVVKNTAEGLKYAANRGLIHRDVKPSNILRTVDGKIKIIDLGLALQQEFEDERVTRDGTTVGTVDYMAPEQARDSRATSIQSDMYSLGCTFYFLLAGAPPFPGGDITDKLTRHAKNPPPNIRDLRPDLPAEVSALLFKLMSKRPEDRFATYDELISAIDWIPLARADRAPSVTLMPVTDGAGAEPKDYDLEATRIHTHREPPSNGSADVPYEEVSMAELAAEEAPRGGREYSSGGSSIRDQPVLERHGTYGVGAESGMVGALEQGTPAAERQSIPVMAFILPGAVLCLAFMILGIGIVQFMGSQGKDEVDPLIAAGLSTGGAIDRGPGARGAGTGAVERPADARERSEIPRPGPAAPAAVLPVKWVEPPDLDPSATMPKPADLPAAVAAKYLPDWARSQIADRVDGPFVTVRRMGNSGNASVVSSLRQALDNFSGGTVELADEGPHAVDDFRFSGEIRQIRARKGLRPIVRLERATGESRKQPALIVLNRKSLILDGIDLVVDARDVSRSQTAIFLCTGGNLTLRNCSITIVNHTEGVPISLVRTEADAARKASRVRLEGSLVRGGFTDGFRLSGGACDVVIRDSLIAARGGPLLRFDSAAVTAENRVFLVQSLVAGPGPMIDLAPTPAAGANKPPSVRAWGSVLGRLRGMSVASVIATSDEGQRPAKVLDWSGDRNLFAGWKGFFASGSDGIVAVEDLSEVRSTWNGTDLESREILAPWAYLGDLAGALAAEFSERAASHARIVEHVARPRAGLSEKAVSRYEDPAVPDLTEWNSGSANVPTAVMMSKPSQHGLPPSLFTNAQANGKATTEARELAFDTGKAPWGGDLGAFLRDNLKDSDHFVRVQVNGSGHHVFTPVKVPKGMRLEIRVLRTMPGPEPAWTSPEGATGTALIELEGGSLVVSNMILRHARTAKFEHLIHVEDSHLVLSNCQLSGGMSAGAGGDLIAFRSATSAPGPLYTREPLFSLPIERPVCRLADCSLITGGRALEAELGAGLVALSHCAVAAGAAAIELKPAKVARRRFNADLVLDRCTLAAVRTIVHAFDWAGAPTGPDRPWLITSRHCAFLGTGTGRTPHETVLLEYEGDAVADGTVFWQGDDDAADVDCFSKRLAFARGAHWKPARNSRK